MNRIRRVFGAARPAASGSGPLSVPDAGIASGVAPDTDTDPTPPEPADTQAAGDPDRPVVVGRLPNTEDAGAEESATSDVLPDPATHDASGRVKVQFPWLAEPCGDAAGSRAAPAADSHDRLANMEVSHPPAPPSPQGDPTAGAPPADPSGASLEAEMDGAEDSSPMAGGRTGSEPPQQAADGGQHDAGRPTLSDIQDGASNTMMAGEAAAGGPGDLAQARGTEASSSPEAGGREGPPSTTQADAAGSGHLELRDALATAIGSGAQDEPSTLVDLSASAPEDPPPPDAFADAGPFDGGDLDLDEPEP